MSLALIVLLPFIGALFPVLMIRAGRSACATTAFVFPLLALVLLLAQAPAVFRGEVLVAAWDWVPALGLQASFFLDGLGMFFAGLILGIGLLVIVYARFYLAKDDPMGVFYSYLLLFQGAMVGVVLSDNILLLLVFWELTSLSSFLLIGYWKHLPEGRQGARMALTVTGAGGLAMIAGMLILGDIAGSWNLTDILREQGRHPGLAAVPARAGADPRRLLHQERAVSLPLLAAARDGGAHPGVGLPALGDHGQGGPVPDGAHVAGARRHAASGSTSSPPPAW